MARRNIIFANGQIYHLFNRSINKEPIFLNISDCNRAVETFKYYIFENPQIRLSYYLGQGVEKRQELEKYMMVNNQTLVEVICFVLMPNHFHILVKQLIENGISKYLSQFQNSYTRYFNTRHKRTGHLFQGQFKGVRIEDDEQFIHISRYIHLNPYTSFVVKTLEELESYRFSSLPDYLSEKNNGFCNKEEILQYFKNDAYKSFIKDQADYQKQQKLIKHLILE